MLRPVQTLLCAALGAFALGALPQAASAATSAGCEGGGFTVTAAGARVGPGQKADLPPAALGPALLVRGKYVEFTVDAASFGIRDYTLTGVANPLDMTGGYRTVVYTGKTPDHRGLALIGSARVESKDASLVLTRAGDGLAMKIQAKDCANGGIFQMEIERGDGSATLVTHTLADGVGYFDNQIFRDREGDTVTYADGTSTKIANRINFGNRLSARFVGRDSPQMATRVNHPSCANVLPNRAALGGTDTVLHCGAVSQWNVASGGRMGQVMGEDATEVSPPATACTTDCAAGNQVRGAATVLGFPFPPTNWLGPRQP